MHVRVIPTVVGPHLWSGSDDKSVRVWGIASSSVQSVLGGHNASVGALCPAMTLADPKVVSTREDVRPVVWSASVDGVIRAWDVTGARPCIRLAKCGSLNKAMSLLSIGGEGEWYRCSVRTPDRLAGRRAWLCWLTCDCGIGCCVAVQCGFLAAATGRYCG